MRQHASYTLWDNITPKVVTSSTDATPIVITATAHGFNTGDLVMIYGHATNIAANGIFKIVKLTANTFQLTDRYTGAAVAGSGAGAGSGGVLMPAKVVRIEDFKHIELQFYTSGTATLTCLNAISLGNILGNSGANGDTPNFGATVSPANPYTFVVVQDNSNGASYVGSSGFAASGTDLAINGEVYTQGIKYYSPILAAFTQGAVSLKLIGYYE